MKERKNVAGPIGAAIAVILAAVAIYFYFNSNTVKYDKNAAIKSAQDIISIVNDRDFQTLYDLLPAMKKLEITPEAYQSKYEPIITSAGSFVEFTKASTSTNTTNDITTIYVIVTAKYENATLTYTISLTMDMRFLEMYVK